MGRGKTEAAWPPKRKRWDTDVGGKLKPLTEDAFTLISFHYGLIAMFFNDG